MRATAPKHKAPVAAPNAAAAGPENASAVIEAGPAPGLGTIPATPTASVIVPGTDGAFGASVGADAGPAATAAPLGA